MEKTSKELAIERMLGEVTPEVLEDKLRKLIRLSDKQIINIGLDAHKMLEIYAKETGQYENVKLGTKVLKVLRKKAKDGIEFTSKEREAMLTVTSVGLYYKEGI